MAEGFARNGFLGQTAPEMVHMCCSDPALPGTHTLAPRLPVGRMTLDGPTYRLPGCPDRSVKTADLRELLPPRHIGTQQPTAPQEATHTLCMSDRICRHSQTPMSTVAPFQNPILPMSHLYITWHGRYPWKGTPWLGAFAVMHR